MMSINLKNFVEDPMALTEVLSVTSEKYDGVIHLVSPKMDGLPLRTERVRETDSWFLSGVFVGIELRPRFLVLRNEHEAFFYITKSVSFLVTQCMVDDSVFEEDNIYERWWRIRC